MNAFSNKCAHMPGNIFPVETDMAVYEHYSVHCTELAVSAHLTTTIYKEWWLLLSCNPPLVSADAI